MTKTSEKCYVGVDVSKAMLDVFITPLKISFQFSNNREGFEQLMEKLADYSVNLIVMEATGGYEKKLAYCLSQKHFQVAVVNPRQMRDFAKATGQLAKTDKIDAKTIATFAEKLEPSANVNCDKNQQKLAGCQARRRQLVDMITMEKNRRDKASKEIKESIERIIKLLEKELEDINEALEQLIQANEEYTQKAILLKTIKGVGKAVSSTLLAELPELGQLTHKKISALAGVAPYNRDSGTYRGKRTVWGGRATVRCALFMATLVAIKYNPQIKSFYDRLCGAGKKKMVAIVACMRKLLMIMNAMIKNNQPWRLCQSY